MFEFDMRDCWTFQVGEYDVDAKIIDQNALMMLYMTKGFREVAVAQAKKKSQDKPSYTFSMNYGPSSNITNIEVKKCEDGSKVDLSLDHFTAGPSKTCLESEIKKFLESNSS